MIIAAIIFLVALIYFELYYLIRPSRLGKKIIEKYNFDYPILVAHRGSSFKAPESTAPAIKQAVKSGIDYIELDLQQTKDGELVIFHDTNLLRLTDVKRVFPEKDSYNLQNFTLAELKKLNYGSWFNLKNPERAQADYSNLEILTLTEVLALVDPVETGVGLALELKSPYLYQGIEKTLVRELAAAEVLENKNEKPRVILLSFSPASLKKLAELRPESPRLLLTKRNFVSPKRWQKWLDLTEEIADGIAPKGHVSFPWYIGAAHKRGLFVLPYVINRSWQLKIMSWFSADGYITDRPQLLANFYDRIQEISESVEEIGESIFEDKDEISDQEAENKEKDD